MDRDFRDAMQLLVLERGRKRGTGISSFEDIVKSCFNELLEHNDIKAMTISLFRWLLFKKVHEIISKPAIPKFISRRACF